jgi:hypothetical protein
MTSYNEKEKNIALAQFIEYLDKQFLIATVAKDEKAAEEIMDFKQSLVNFKKKLDSILLEEDEEEDEEITNFFERNFRQG